MALIANRAYQLRQARIHTLRAAQKREDDLRVAVGAGGSPGPAPWWDEDSIIDIDFLNNRAWLSGTGEVALAVAFTTTPENPVGVNGIELEVQPDGGAPKLAAAALALVASVASQGITQIATFDFTVSGASSLGGPELYDGAAPNASDQGGGFYSDDGHWLIENFDDVVTDEDVPPNWQAFGISQLGKKVGVTLGRPDGGNFAYEMASDGAAKTASIADDLATAFGFASYFPFGHPNGFVFTREAGTYGTRLTIYSARPFAQLQSMTQTPHLSLSTQAVAEDLLPGLDIAEISFVDALDREPTLDVEEDNSDYVDLDGTYLNLENALDYETASTFDVVLRATFGDAVTCHNLFRINVADIVEDTHNPDLPASQGTLVYDGGFAVNPTKNNSGSNLKLQGKSGGTAKFILDIGPAVANTTYTMRYDPDFSLLSNTGKEAFVGFGFLKTGNDFHMTGLKGNGASGLNAYKIYGAAKFNASSGFTTVDDGAAAFGTQAGPNWLQLAVAEDGSTYTLRTSNDGQSWTDEFTDDLPDPISGSDDATTFGIAVFLENSDKGTFSIDIQVWAAVTASSNGYEFLGSDEIAADVGAPPSVFGPFGPFDAGSWERIFLATGSVANDRTFVAVKVHVPSMAADPTGTTMSVVTGSYHDGGAGANSQAEFCTLPVTWSGAFEVSVEVNHIENACGVALWGATGTNGAPVEVEKAQLVGTYNPTLTTVAGGFALGYAFGRNNGNNPSHTWSGGLTERFDTLIETGTGHSAADGETSGTSMSPSCVLAGLNLYNSVVIISFEFNA